MVAPSALMMAGVTPRESGWLLETDDTRIEIAVQDDRPVVSVLGARGDDHEWAHDTSIRIVPNVFARGVRVAARWAFASAEVDPAADALTLRFTCAEPELELTSIWRASPGRGPVVHWAGLLNSSAQTVTVGRLDSLALDGLAVPAGSEFWWIRRGGSNASTEGGTFHDPAVPGGRVSLVSNPDDGASPVPWLAVQQGDERGLYVGWEFSGVGGIDATVSPGGDSVRLRAGCQDDFLTYLAPGRSLAIPPAFIGCYRGDIEEGSYSLHRFIMEHLRLPMPDGVPDPVTVLNPFADVGMWNATEADVLRTARYCGDLGFETYVSDAMWFPHVGDWRWDPKRFPRGVAPLEEYVHSRGMLHGLWCAWTNGGLSDDPGAANVRRQADWFQADVPDGWEPGPFYGGRMCLACDEAREWAARETQRMVREFGLNYYKHDIGPIVTTCARTDHRHTHDTDVSYWATMGYYQVMEHLRQAYPRLVLENCSGGGHIKDFGVIRRTHYTVTTDTLSNLPDRQSIYDSTYALPPCLLQAYTYDNMYPVEGDDPGSFLWRSAMMSAWQTAPSHTRDWSDEAWAQTRRAVETYKEWIRPILRDARVHHLLPRPDGLNWDGMFYWSPTLRKGTVYVFRPASDVAERAIRLKGLDPDKRYRVWCDDGSIEPGPRTARELMAAGLTVRLPYRYSSDLIYVQDESDPAPELPQPEAFELREPKVSADPFRVRADLSWRPSRGARCYRVVVRESGGSPGPVLDTIVVRSRVDAVGLSPERDYAWTVTAVGWGGRADARPSPGRFRTPPVEPLPGVVFLSDLAWETATIGVDAPVLRDRDYYGKTLAVGGKVLPKGLWTHAYSDATPADFVFDTTGHRDTEFRATVGLDDRSGGGSVQFQVLLDGTLSAESPVLRTGESHEFRVPVGGAARLTLRVLNGGDGHSCDHAVWGLARLLQAGARDLDG